jgi:poly-gamma-glutamate synthesis protein (capsule biosynthesis protein)
LAFGGDVHFEGVDRARLLRNPTTAVGPIAPLLRRADVAMVNLETAVTDRGDRQAKQFAFRAPPTAFSALRAAGVDVATQANNHGMDYGVVGLRDSIAAARRSGFPVVGIGLDADAAFAPWVTTVRGQRVAFLGATQVLDANLMSAWTAGHGKPGLGSAKDEPRLVAAVQAARRRADVVVVYLHWGTELHSCPTETQTGLAKALAAAGADVVVGSHAHVVLGGGWLGRTYVGYGLGNFVFYARSGPTLQSGVLTLRLTGRRVTGAAWSPARISGGVPVPLHGGARDAAARRWERLRRCTGLASAPPA